MQRCRKGECLCLHHERDGKMIWEFAGGKKKGKGNKGGGGTLRNCRGRDFWSGLGGLAEAFRAGNRW